MGHRVERFTAFVEADRRLDTAGHAPARLCTELEVGVHLKAAFAARRRWPAQPGVFSLTGGVSLPRLSGEILFRNGPASDPPPVNEDRATVTIVSEGHAISMPPQLITCTPRRAMELRLRVPHPAGPPAWQEHDLGRFLGERLEFELELPARASLDASFTPEASADGQRTSLKVDGQLRFEPGLSARLLIGAHDLQGPASELGGGEVVLLPAGTTVPIARQTVSGLAGPHPWVSVRILEAGVRMLVDDLLLGRSVLMP